jgi:mandelamide amidase
VPALKLFLQRYVPTLTFEDLLDQMSPEMQATFKDFAMPGGADYTGAEEYRLAQGRVRVIRSSMREYFRANRLDAIAFPTTLVAAQPIGENREVEISGAKIAFSTAVAQNVAIGTCASLPGLVIPAGMAPELLPVGMEFDGPRGTDRRILGLGLSIEALLGQLPAPAV